QGDRKHARFRLPPSSGTAPRLRSGLPRRPFARSTGNGGWPGFRRQTRPSGCLRSWSPSVATCDVLLVLYVRLFLFLGRKAARKTRKPSDRHISTQEFVRMRRIQVNKLEIF